MNRLWVLISLVIVGVVLIVTLSPIIARAIDIPPDNPSRSVDRGAFRAPDINRNQGAIERRLWTNLLRTLFVGAIVGLIAGIILARGLVAPLRHLEEGAKAISHHQLKHRVPEKGSYEMRSVARSFNQMAADLEREEVLRRNMLADITHELRHPIHILQGSLQAILDRVYQLDMEEINRLLDQTQNLAALVDDLHELALAEAHELPLNKEDTDLGELVRTTAEAYKTLAAHKSIAIQTQIAATPPVLCVDPTRICQALQNLLSNALRYTPEGGTVSVSLSESQSAVKIRVEDTGVGIAPENLPRVFDRFYREDNSRSRSFNGTGLGLAIAQAIVRTHGGEIIAESAGPNRGSTFTIELPTASN